MAGFITTNPKRVMGSFVSQLNSQPNALELNSELTKLWRQKNRGFFARYVCLRKNVELELKTHTTDDLRLRASIRSRDSVARLPTMAFS